MNNLIKQIFYHTHDKWLVEIKYRKETYNFLQFCLDHRKKDTEILLKDILNRIEKYKAILPAKGLMFEFNKYMPELVHDFTLLYQNNKLMKGN